MVAELVHLARCHKPTPPSFFPHRSVHHHGMASLPAFDGWADQYFCYDETKDYVLPNNRHATQYYHDHAVAITSENAYNGEHAAVAASACSKGNTCHTWQQLLLHEYLPMAKVARILQICTELTTSTNVLQG